MQITVPPDLEAVIQERIASGQFANPEELFRVAVETLNSDETWTLDERNSLDLKLDRALEQARTGKVYGPAAALAQLASLRKAHLATYVK